MKYDYLRKFCLEHFLRTIGGPIVDDYYFMIFIGLILQRLNAFLSKTLSIVDGNYNVDHGQLADNFFLSFQSIAAKAANSDKIIQPADSL